MYIPMLDPLVSVEQFEDSDVQACHFSKRVFLFFQGERAGWGGGGEKKNFINYYY